MRAPRSQPNRCCDHELIPRGAAKALLPNRAARSDRSGDMMKTFKIRAAIAVCSGGLLSIAFPLSASAHITIGPYIAAPGSYALVTFRVPNESASAKTTRVEVDIPGDTGFADVSYVPVPGWTATMTTATLTKPIVVAGNELKVAVNRVIFTADPGRGLQNRQLQLFELSMGQVPNVGRVYLPTIQTYDDGTEIRWDQRGTDGEHPAPVLYVNDAPVVSQDSDAEVTAASEAERSPTASNNDVLARGLGIGGVAVGAVGILLAAGSRRRATKK